MLLYLYLLIEILKRNPWNFSFIRMAISIIGSEHNWIILMFRKWLKSHLLATFSDPGSIDWMRPLCSCFCLWPGDRAQEHFISILLFVPGQQERIKLLLRECTVLPCILGSWKWNICGDSRLTVDLRWDNWVS